MKQKIGKSDVIGTKLPTDDVILGVVDIVDFDGYYVVELDEWVRILRKQVEFKNRQYNKIMKDEAMIVNSGNIGGYPPKRQKEYTLFKELIKKEANK